MKTIKSKILFIAGASALLFCAVIIWLTSNASEKYRAVIASDCAYVVDSRFQYIEDSLKLFEEQAKDLARLGGVYYRMTVNGVEINKDDIIDNLRLDYDFIGGGVWYAPYSVFPDKDRFCFYAYKDGDEVVYDEEFESSAYDYLRQEWYVDIMGKLKSGKKVAWHEPYVDEAGSHAAMMTVGAGIYSRESELIGMATADLSIDFMLNLSADLNFTPGTSISVVYEKTGNIISEAGPWDSADALEFSNLFDNGVRLSLSVPKDELYGDVDIMVRNMLVITLAIIILSFIVIYSLLDRLLNRPMSYLSAKTGEIGKGNLDIVIETKNDDEIGQLGATINKMTGDLKQYIENLESVTKENTRIRSELEIAGKIQQEMLPALKLNNDGYDIYAKMFPCLEVGGDFYDAFPIGVDKQICIVIADVSGKGVPAALFMANAKTTLKSFAQTELSPAEILTKANRQLSYGNKTRMFVTAFLGILNLRTGEFSYANAGHNPPFIMRGGNSFEYLNTSPGIVLGISKNAVYTESSVKLNSGDRIFLYTDGVTETFNERNEPFGEVRLKNVLDECKEEGLIEMTVGVEKELYTFADGTHMRDDITMLLVKLVGR